MEGIVFLHAGLELNDTRIRRSACDIEKPMLAQIHRAIERPRENPYRERDITRLERPDSDAAAIDTIFLRVRPRPARIGPAMVEIHKRAVLFEHCMHTCRC